MRNILGSSLASLAVLHVLFVLLSGHRDIPSSSGLITNTARISDAGDRLIQVIVLRRQRQLQLKDYPTGRNTDRIMKVQQALKTDGLYSGSLYSGSIVHGTIVQSTHETIRSVQESSQLIVTRTVDNDMGRSWEFY